MAWTALKTRNTRRTNYPYAVARVQAKRGKLLSRADWDKLLKMDVSEITRFIEESQYKAEVDELGSRFSGLDLLEAALTVNEERTYAGIRKMLDGGAGEVLGHFLDRYFVNDLKTVLRGKAAGATREELLKELLLEDLDTYNVFLPLLSEDLSGLEDTLDALDRQGGIAARWAKVLRKVPDGSPLPRYEDALDKAYYAGLLEAVEDRSDKGIEAVEEFVRQEIDARNLHNVARWVHAGAEGDFSPYVIPGGKSLRVSDIMALADADDLAAFEEHLSGKPLYDRVRGALETAQETGRLAPFGLAVQHTLMGDLDRLAHKYPLSILPILTYLLRKRHEVVSLRTLARGRAAGLSERRLKELIHSD